MPSRSRAELEIMELLWQNGEVVIQRQNQRSPRKSHLRGGASAEQREIRSDEETAANHQLFMQEDEMASWLQYPLDDSSFDRDFYADLLGPAAPSAPSAPVATAVPPPPQQRYQNFSRFSTLKGRIESGILGAKEFKSPCLDSKTGPRKIKDQIKKKIKIKLWDFKRLSRKEFGGENFGASSDYKRTHQAAGSSHTS